MKRQSIKFLSRQSGFQALSLRGSGHSCLVSIDKLCICPTMNMHIKRPTRTRNPVLSKPSLGNASYLSSPSGVFFHPEVSCTVNYHSCLGLRRAVRIASHLYGFLQVLFCNSSLFKARFADSSFPPRPVNLLRNSAPNAAHTNRFCQHFCS